MDSFDQAREQMEKERWEKFKKKVGFDKFIKEANHYCISTFDRGRLALRIAKELGVLPKIRTELSWEKTAELR